MRYSCSYRGSHIKLLLKRNFYFRFEGDLFCLKTLCSTAFFHNLSFFFLAICSCLFTMITLLIGRFVIIVTIFFKSILAPSGRGKTFRLGNTIFAISRKFWGLLRFLRETKVGEFRSSNTAILTHLRLWFVTVSSRKWRFPQIGGYYLVTHSHKWRLISRRLADFFVKLAYFLGNLRFGEIE